MRETKRQGRVAPGLRRECLVRGVQFENFATLDDAHAHRSAWICMEESLWFPATRPVEDSEEEEGMLNNAQIQTICEAEDWFISDYDWTNIEGTLL